MTERRAAWPRSRRDPAANCLPASAFRTGAPEAQLDSGRYAEGLELALETARYGELRAWQARERARGRLIGIGLSCYVEFTGMGPSRIMAAMGNRQGGYETAVVRVDPSGHATVASGVIEIGQGIRSRWPRSPPTCWACVETCGWCSVTRSSARTAATAPAASVAPWSVRIVLEAHGCESQARQARCYLLEAAEDDVEGPTATTRARRAAGGGSAWRIAREAYRGQRLPPCTDGARGALRPRPPQLGVLLGRARGRGRGDRDTGTVTVVGYWLAHDAAR